MPADDQAIALPCASVMVIMVLLKLAFTCATPAEMFLRSRRRMRWGSRAIGIILEKLVGTLRPAPHAIRRRNSGAIVPRTIAAAVPTSSYQQSAWPCPCGCAHWYACAARGPAGPCDGEGRDSRRGPSNAW